MAPRVVPTHTLDIVSQMSQDTATGEKTMCNVFGIFLQEDQQQTTTFWVLCDERCYHGLKIKLIGDLKSYPKPKRGDIVRVHRLMFDRYTRMPIIMNPINVVFWSAFAYDPTPVTTARQPTINDDDIERRRALETFYCSLVTSISDIKQAHQRSQSTGCKLDFFDVAGRVNQNSLGKYNEYQIMISDGTGEIIIRVFPKTAATSYESNAHHDVAKEIKSGDYIAVTSTKLHKSGEMLDLSANTNNGRTLRFIEKTSIIGVILSNSLDSAQEQMLQIEDAPSRELRRSPRLQSKQGSQNITSTSQGSQPQSQDSNSTSPIRPKVLRPPQQEPLPDFTKLCDIPGKERGKFEFVNIVGQVRGKPLQNESYYSNWLFQIFDGSKLVCPCNKSELIPDYSPECAVVIVYEPKRPEESRKHVNVVEKLEDGDLVYIKNIKAIWKFGKLSLEMGPYENYNKSIEVIERNSQFGIYLLDMITLAIDDEDQEQYHSAVNSENEMESEE